MKTMVISEFKAKCIATVKQVKRLREPVLLTIRGEPYAVIEPVETDGPPRVLGAQPGAMEILGDIVSVDFSDDWDLNRAPEKITDPGSAAR